MKPKKLTQGDRVGIISTARKITEQELESCIITLENWGLKTVIGRSVNAHHFQFAGDDALRMNDLQTMLDDDSISAILFARGGYGTVRIIDEIDWRSFMKHPRWLCGFSDITVIHSHLQSIYNLPSVHSIMGFNFTTATDESKATLQKVLFGQLLQYELPVSDFNRNGSARGILCGGNLSILCNLLGSVSDLNTDGKILFIEDIDEHLYHLDRMMITMKRAGKFENLAGLVVGHFTGMKNKDDSNPFGKTAYEIIAEHVSEFGFPVCFGFPAGHEPDNRALIFGVEWNLKVESEGVFFAEV